MSLTDLYKALDWTSVDETFHRWKSYAPGVSEDVPEEDFVRSFRLRLLMYALPTEIVGKQPDWTPEIQHSARWALKAAGVWDQAVDWLVSQKLLGPLDKERASQLSLFGDVSHEL
jgi:hypothetical protein